jgi:hypothetical protein
MDWLQRIEGTVRGIERDTLRTVERGTALGQGAAQAAWTQDSFEVGKDFAAGIRQGADRVGTAVVHVPGELDTWSRLYQAAKTGQRTLLPGQMPAYPTLEPGALAIAIAAGKGQQVAQPYLQDNAQHRGSSEPVTLLLTSSRQDLEQALKQQGWTQNHARTPLNYIRQGLSVLTRYNRVSDGPVSKQYLNGKLEDLAFSKNCDYNLSRDHMRVYRQGTDAGSGLPVWAIAATRDVAATVTLKEPKRNGLLPWNWTWRAPSFGHNTDPNVDGERDLIMHDLLATGQVKEWQAVDGKPTGPAWKRQKDGSVQVGSYTSDGKVYRVKLGSA